jgi:uncharacterized protein DUF2510
MPDPSDRGWYPDPDGTPRLRLWNGAGWTPHYAPPPATLDLLFAAGDHRAGQARKRSRRAWITAGVIMLVVFGGASPGART